MKAPSTVSPLRYPGGKGKLADYFCLVLEENNMLECSYVEPYAGGASVAIHFLLNEYAKDIHINDANYAIFSFWNSVVNNPEEILKRLHEKKVSVAEWKRQKAILSNQKDHSEWDVGFSAFYLNRTNISGIVDGGGIIGGLKQTGKWKIDARFNKPELEKRILKIALMGSRVKVTNLDAIELIDQCISKLPKKSLVYFDPPYFVNGKKLYENYYKDDDHKKVGEKIQSIKNCSWVVTYDNHPRIKSIYKHSRKRSFSIGYSAATAYVGKEIMVFSDDLAVPYVRDPITYKYLQA